MQKLYFEGEHKTGEAGENRTQWTHLSTVDAYKDIVSENRLSVGHKLQMSSWATARGDQRGEH